MQNDVRLIDANALKKALMKPFNWNNSPEEIQEQADFDYFEVMIGAASTIDAVPVVRCKDCKNRGTPYSCPMRKLVMPFQGAGSYEDCTDDEGYCHMGVKMDEPSP